MTPTVSVGAPQQAGRGILLVLSAAVLWGTTGTAQSLVPAQLSSAWVGALRLAVAALFFGVWLAATKPLMLRPAALTRLPWRGIAAAAACMTLYNLAFFAGVRASGVAVGTAIALGSGPVWAGGLQAMFQRRAPGRAWWAGTVLAVSGGALMIGSAEGATALSVAGMLACITAGLAYAAYALINQRLVATAPVAPTTGAIFGLAAAMALPLAGALAGWPTLRADDILVVAWLGVASTGVAYLLFSHGLRSVSGATAVTLALAEPVTAFGLALVVVGERPGLLAVVGLGVVLAGLALVVRTELRADTPGIAPQR